MAHALIFVVAMTSFSLHASNVQAASLRPVDYRVLATVNNFDDTWQYAVTFRMRPPRRLRASHLELAVGAFSSTQDTRPFVSLGPVWRFPLNRSPDFFVDLGFSPTLVAGSTFNGEQIGGILHFTTSASVGAIFGARDKVSVSLRIQHTSNGGLNGTNPGLDMVGFNFTYNFNEQ